jgi:phenylacetate-CoA ligase
VRDTAAFAARSVPFYRDRLDAPAVRTAADLARLPLLDRATLQAEGDRLRADGGRGALRFRTTGSTAAPVTVWHDHESLLANIGYGERERAVEAHFVGRRRRYSALDLRAAGGTLPRVQAFYASAAFRPLRPGRTLVDVDTPPEQVLEAIERGRPEVIRSYGAFLELLFRTAAASGGLRHRPRVVLYAGDTMSDPGRELIEGGFGIPVISAYNAVECFKIAFTCERRDGFHLHEDLCHVRVVDAGGGDVPAGERGEVVISNLVNRGTVLLNYRLGDVGRLVDEPCGCGRTTSRLVDLEGRVDELIDLGGGEWLYPTAVWRAFRERPAILRYQLVQNAPRRFELRVVAGGDDGEAAAHAAAAELATSLHGAVVAPVLVDELPAGPGGKFRHVVPLPRTGDPARAVC